MVGVISAVWEECKAWLLLYICSSIPMIELKASEHDFHNVDSHVVRLKVLSVSNLLYSNNNVKHKEAKRHNRRRIQSQPRLFDGGKTSV